MSMLKERSAGGMRGRATNPVDPCSSGRALRSLSVFAHKTAAVNHRHARIRPMRRDASRRQHHLPGGAHNGNAGLTPTLPLTRGSTANPPAVIFADHDTRGATGDVVGACVQSPPVGASANPNTTGLGRTTFPGGARPRPRRTV